MTRVSILALAAVTAACAHNNDLASQQVEPSVASAVESQGGVPDGAVVNGNEGRVTVAGIEPARVLGAIDTAAVVQKPVIADGGDAPAATPPQAGASSGIAVEGAQASAVLAAIDPTKLVGPSPTQGSGAAARADGYIAPEVQAVVTAKKAYTTRDLQMAQLEAVKGEGG
jgi:hypothetical protein